MTDLAARVRPEIPLLAQRLGEHPLVFLDAASTTPKPRVVIDAVHDYYETSTANVHRGVHPLGEIATQKYEAARLEVASLIGSSPSEVVFVRGTTEAINLVAHGLGLRDGDEVVFPASEHHANYLPWRVRATPVVMPIDDGVPRWDTLGALISPRTKLVAFAHVSNVTGAIAPVRALVETAHARGVPVLLDAAQSLSHVPLDVRTLGVDFLAASAHKAFGPSGVGILYAKADRLARLGLYQVGGGMVAVNRDEEGGDFVPRDPPFRFEAGTPAIESTIGFGAAVRFLRSLGWPAIEAHERAIADQLLTGLRAIRGVRVLGNALPLGSRVAVVTFVVDAPGIEQEHVARMLADNAGICVSGGYHCTHVLHAREKLAGTVRASAHVYNTSEEIELFLRAVRDIAE